MQGIGEGTFASKLVRHQQQAMEVRRRAAQLRAEAERARAHAVTAIEVTRLRRQGQPRPLEYVEFQAEQDRGTRELAAYIKALRNEQDELRQEVALQDAWFGEQVLGMLEQGWSRADLAEIGFGDEFLARLGLQDHPGLK